MKNLIFTGLLFAVALLPSVGTQSLATDTGSCASAVPAGSSYFGSSSDFSVLAFTSTDGTTHFYHLGAEIGY